MVVALFLSLKIMKKQFKVNNKRICTKTNYKSKNSGQKNINMVILNKIGDWPSGKALDSDSSMHVFESHIPSQFYLFGG